MSHCITAGDLLILRKRDPKGTHARTLSVDPIAAKCRKPAGGEVEIKLSADLDQAWQEIAQSINQSVATLRSARSCRKH
jgi:hypothetical protein